jgi:uncharacterized membrane protein YGL010W
MNDLNVSRVSLSIHTIAGIVAGYISYMLADNLYAFGTMIVILIITGYGTEFALKKKSVKWWLSNGGALYILVWLISWIFLFNI